MPIITATRVIKAQWWKAGIWKDIPGFVAGAWFPVVYGLNGNPEDNEPGLSSVSGYIYTIDQPTIIEMMSYTFDFGGPKSQIRIDYQSNEGAVTQNRRLYFDQVFFMGFGRAQMPSDHSTLKQDVSGTELTRIPFKCAILNLVPMSNFVADFPI